jgi:hypothetical protein
MTDKVPVCRQGSAILESAAQDWTWLSRLIGAVDDDFAAAAEEPAPLQERPGLDLLK